MARHAKLLVITTAALTASMCAGETSASTPAAYDPGAIHRLSIEAHDLAAARPVLHPGKVLDRTLLVHRILVEVHAADPGSDWEVHVVASFRDESVTLARLGPSATELVLSRPLGYLLRPGDRIRAVWTGPAGVPGEATVHVEYEPVEGPVSRLGVVPATLTGSDGPDRVSWTAPVSGRILAFADVPTDSELVLIDEDTGRVLWRGTLGSATGQAFGSGGSVMRAGVPVEAGRSYRLVVSGAPAAEVQALILPSRVATVALR
jgi:hypothetical protein